MNLRIFGRALLCRSLWRGIYAPSPWGKIIRIRYLKGRPVEFWFRRGIIGPRSGSPIWNKMRKIEPFFISRLRWRLYSSGSVHIGIDPLICNQSDINLPMGLIFQLQRQGIYTWDKLIKDWHGSTHVWKNGRDLHLQDIWDGIWKSITDQLNGSAIHRYGEKDQLLWTVSFFQSPVSVKDIYSHLINNRIPYQPPIFPYIFWKAKCPPKIIHFAWLVFYNKNLSWTTSGKDIGKDPADALCVNQKKKQTSTCSSNAQSSSRPGMYYQTSLIFS